MTDIVVTVPKNLWIGWIYEGDAVGEPATGGEWGFYMGGPVPDINPGERVYVVSHGLLRGYAPLTRLQRTDRGYALCRKAGAVAVTIDQEIPGFRGCRYRWWDHKDERPFPEWMFAGVATENQRDKRTLRYIERCHQNGEPIRTPVHVIDELFTKNPEQSR